MQVIPGSLHPQTKQLMHVFSLGQPRTAKVAHALFGQFTNLRCDCSRCQAHKAICVRSAFRAACMSKCQCRAGPYFCHTRTHAKICYIEGLESFVCVKHNLSSSPAQQCIHACRKSGLVYPELFDYMYSYQWRFNSKPILWRQLPDLLHP